MSLPKGPSGGSRRVGGRLRAHLARTRVQAALIFFLLLVAYLANRDFLPGNDATANVRLAGKVVSQHKLVFTPEEDPFMFEWHLQTPEGQRHARFRSWRSNLNGESIRSVYERGDLKDPHPHYYLMKTRFPGVYANRYGLGAGLFAVPFVAAVYPFARDFYQRSSVGLLWFATKVAVSCAVAASAVLLFLVALPFLRPGTAVWLALAYGLGTSAWSAASQTLWQHGPMEFFLALGTYFLMQRERPRAAYGVGLSYALAFACRPTAAVAVVAAGIYFLLRDRRALVRCVVGGLPVGAYGGRKDIMNKVAPVGPVYQAGTLSGNPLAVAAGLAMLRYLKRHPEVYGQLEARTAELCAAAPAGVTVNRVGSMFTWFFTDQPVTDYESAKRSDTARFGRYFRAMLERGIYLAPSQFEAAFVSAAHTEEDIRETIAAAGEACSAG